MEPGHQHTASPTTDNTELRRFFERYLRYWRWFVLSCIICIGLAYTYLRYTTPQYAASARIMLGDDKKTAPEMAIFEDLNFLSGSGNKVEDEIQIIKSRTLMTKVVKERQLNIQYYTEGRIHEIELFPEVPVKLNFIASDSTLNQSDFTFNIEIKSETSFNYQFENETKVKHVDFGENIITPSGDMVIIPAINNIERFKNTTIKIRLQPVNKVAEYYRNKIVVSPIEEGSSVVQISLNDPVIEKAKQIINTLIQKYQENTVEEEKLIAKNTADFISSRIDLIATDLSNVDQVVEQFKIGNRLTDIASEADIYLSSGSENEQKLSAARTELSMVNYMNDYVEEQSSYELIPSNIGLSDPSITSITSKYNELVLERQRLLKSSSEKNPIIVNLNQQLDGLKQGMQQSLRNLSNSLNIQVSDLERQSARINYKISSVPGQEREFRDIQRQQQIKESLYLYLLQKREEAAISVAATSVNAKVIDPAYGKSDVPISPRRKMVFLAALLAGLAIPFSVIYAGELLDTKIHNKEDLEKIIKQIPLLGELPRVKIKKGLPIIQRYDRSILSESFRIMRSNLDYFIRARNGEQNNIIYVTSTINGEGKTFVSMNLALTLANSDKKVLLIGADIRNPKLHLFLKKSLKRDGLTDYLHNHLLKSRDIIGAYEVNNNHIDVIQSGKIPPNPAELLMSDRMGGLLDNMAAKYDFVIVDTAPAMLVTDTLLISRYAHHTIYVTRAGYTDKRLLNFPKELYQDKRLNGMMMVVNDVKASNFGYGAKYGYGNYGEVKKTKKLRI
ncbi:polysaccharide biosynthesis tyrosine autokinase [Leptobacterium sp. I13]|uniref:GumC family protein n=1 Tax=Leptobacterium meishanense TaxID=3128904 RepID=UPI0030ECB635